MTPYAKAGERVYGTRTRVSREGVERVEDYHHCTVRHDLFLEELPDFPACLGDWQQEKPPVQREYYYTTTGTATETKWVELGQHGNGSAPMFGVPWSGESWWRWFDHDNNRETLNYDLRFRGTNGTCTWGMDRLQGTST
jgi:hypothetical protein